MVRKLVVLIFNSYLVGMSCCCPWYKKTAAPSNPIASSTVDDRAESQVSFDDSTQSLIGNPADPVELGDVTSAENSNPPQSNPVSNPINGNSIALSDATKDWTVYPLGDITNFVEIIGQGRFKKDGMTFESFCNSGKQKGLLILPDGKMVAIYHNVEGDEASGANIVHLANLSLRDPNEVDIAQDVRHAIQSFESFCGFYGEIKEFDEVCNDSELQFFGKPMLAIYKDREIKNLVPHLSPGEGGYFIDASKARETFEFKGKELVFERDSSIAHSSFQSYILNPESKIDKYLILDRDTFKQQIADFIAQENTESASQTISQLASDMPTGALAIVKINDSSGLKLLIHHYQLVQKGKTELFLMDSMNLDRIDWNTLEIKEMPFRERPNLLFAGFESYILEAMGLTESPE